MYRTCAKIPSVSCVLTRRAGYSTVTTFALRMFRPSCGSLSTYHLTNDRVAEGKDNARQVGRNAFSTYRETSQEGVSSSPLALTISTQEVLMAPNYITPNSTAKQPGGAQ